MTAPVFHLRAVPDEAAADPDVVSAAELAARDEVAHARRELPRPEPAVWDCYLGDLTAAIAPTSEADPIAILASLTAAAGVYLGENPRVQAGDDRHPLLVWPLIIGRTGAGRKGASWSAARRLLAAADPTFTAMNIRSGLTSGEGLAAIFAEDDPDDDKETTHSKTKTGGRGLLPVGDRRLMVFEPEWASVMARMRREGNTLSATLRAAWEGGDLSTLTVTARVASSSHIGLLTHITPEEFRAKLSSSDLAGGTYNRFLPIAAARSQFLPLSTGAPGDLVEQLGASLAARLTAGTQLAALAFTGSATALWRELYVEFGTDHGDTGPVEQFLSRTAPNCLRIAAIHAALDRKDAIDYTHLAAAAALVRYSIASVRTVFAHNSEMHALAAYIAAAGTGGRSRRDITREHFAGNRKSAEISEFLDRLTTAGTVTLTRRTNPAGGRPAEIYTTAGARDPTH